MNVLPVFLIVGVSCAPLFSNIVWADAAHEPTIARIQVRMQTTGEGKDGNTQVLDHIIIGGKEIAELDCCSSGNNGPDVWNSGSDQTRDFKLVPGIRKADLPGATVKFGMRPNGNDKWSFIATLIVTDSNGSVDRYSFGDFALESKDNYTDRVFTIPKE